MELEPSRDKYTQKEDWDLFWSKFKPFIVKKSNLDDLCKDFPLNGTFIEIGGFPGVNSIYFKKYFNFDVYLLDYIIIPEILLEMEKINNLPFGSINQIKTDFFEYNTENKFDVVFSSGFIEHFKDLHSVIKQHVSILKENGKLLILIPNLKGMSGLFLKWTDINLFKKHNLDSMDLEVLTNILNSLNLKNIQVKYFGKPHVWINTSSPFYNKLTRTIIKYFNGISQRIPIKNQFFSPTIAIKAVK